MTLLQIMPADDPTAMSSRTSDPAAIATALDVVGVRYVRLELAAPPDGATAEQVLGAYRADVERIRAESGCRVVDVARIGPQTDPKTAGRARAGFRAEHRHDEDEVRLFVRGAGCFYLHIGERVLAVLCTAGDLLSVPAGTAHWFDTGERPDFVAIRFFEQADGWVGRFHPDSIAAAFPSLDDLLAPA